MRAEAAAGDRVPLSAVLLPELSGDRGPTVGFTQTRLPDSGGPASSPAVGRATCWNRIPLCLLQAKVHRTLPPGSLHRLKGVGGFLEFSLEFTAQTVDLSRESDFPWRAPPPTSLVLYHLPGP